MKDNSLKGTCSATRNWARWHNTQLYVTVGALALKDQYRPTEAPMWEQGTVLGNGLLRVTGLWREGRQWLYHVVIDRVIHPKKTVWEVYALLKDALKRRREQRSEGAELVGSRTPAPTRMLPAPRNTIAGLLPAVCA